VALTVAAAMQDCPVPPASNPSLHYMMPLGVISIFIIPVAAEKAMI